MFDEIKAYEKIANFFGPSCKRTVIY